MKSSLDSKLTFQEIIYRLERYWMNKGCIAWLPHHEMVGAGTYNPATVLRVLGPEPWNVAYVEPSFRPDDGRFADNPNRMQMHHQYQVILKPPPSDPQELYLGSLAELGIDFSEHDVRFVEDNWESPALGAWGLGWEVWLDGMEITQFTYFQQAGGVPLDPPACELTYGLDRIAMYLQGVGSVWDLKWNDNVGYAEILKRQEIEFCEYDFNVADIGRIRQFFDLFEAEAKHSIERKLAAPAYDYVARCSHHFNILDTRGAIGLSERVAYFARMRDLTKQVSDLFAEQRKDLGYPLTRHQPPVVELKAKPEATKAETAQTLLLELGAEELTASAVVKLSDQLRDRIPVVLKECELAHGEVYVTGTPRRLVVMVKELTPRQADKVQWNRGPAKEQLLKNAAAMAGFCRKNNISEGDIVYKIEKGVECAFARVERKGRSAGEVLSESLPKLLRELQTSDRMRWMGSAQYGDEAKTSFNRPVRWAVCLYGAEVVSFQFAGVVSGRASRGGRWCGAPVLEIKEADGYLAVMEQNQIAVDIAKRTERIRALVMEVVQKAGGTPRLNDAVLQEVAQLVEYPTAFLCGFDPKFIELPSEVLVSVLEKHTRCFAVFTADGKILPAFVGVRNGGPERMTKVQEGFETLIRARFSDAAFFISRDREHKLEDFRENIKKLKFHAKLGSMFEKCERLEKLSAALIAGPLKLSLDTAALRRAAVLAKADLGTEMVTEMTSLQGAMGRIYAKQCGESEKVASALYEQYLPRFSGDGIPQTPEGLALSITDRIDTLSAFFSVGAEPTGSADPFGLRREALAVLACLTGSKTHISLKAAIDLAVAEFAHQVAPNTTERLLDFLAKRFEVNLRDEGFRHDVVRAVLAAYSDDPYAARCQVAELHELVTSQDPAVNEQFKASTLAYLRCRNIVDAALTKKIEVAAAPEERLFDSPEERELGGALSRVQAELAAVKGLPAMQTLYRQLFQLAPVINVFFDKIMVMAEDPAVRANRLALVNAVAELVAPYADLRKLEGFKV